MAQDLYSPKHWRCIRINEDPDAPGKFKLCELYSHRDIKEDEIRPLNLKRTPKLKGMTLPEAVMQGEPLERALVANRKVSR